MSAKSKDWQPDRRWEREGYLSAAQLAHRPGWTPGRVRQLLGRPDREVPNQYYRSGPEMALYSLRRIEAVEETPEFERERELLERRRSAREEAAARAAETRRRRLLEAIDGLQVTIPFIDRETLIARAVNAYNAHWAEINERRGTEKWASLDDSIEFLARISVNYLRHRLRTYTNGLAHIQGRTGKEEAYKRLKARVLDAIASQYPWLEDECARQKEDCINGESS